MVAASSIAGIAATACGFSFPAIFFLDQQLYHSMVANPIFFVSLVSCLVFIGGWFGILVATIFENHVRQDDQKYTFPIGQMIFTMANNAHSQFQSAQLWAGSIAFAAWAWAQQKTLLLPSTVTVTQRALLFFKLPAVRFDFTVLPMLISIGFVTGHVIAKPLVAGIALKLLFLDPLRSHYYTFLTATEFLLAFCAGMVLCGILHAIISIPQSLKSLNHTIMQGHYKTTLRTCINIGQLYLLEWIFFLILFCFACWYLQISLVVQLYTLITTYFCVYSMIIIGATMGIAPLGRFATFVMVPALFLFSLDYVQLICIATFVEIAGGVAVDVLFGRKAARLANINHTWIRWVQYAGLCLASLFCGVIFLLLSSKFQLGSSVLGAYKAQARALLIHAHQFNYVIVTCGIACGWFLGKCKINPSMVLGGILMPFDYSFALVAGGTLGTMLKQKNHWIPAASAIFAANSLWMIIKAMIY
jgi:hypothetical protein